MTAVFANSPFDSEIRFDCIELRMKSEKYGEICILPDYHRSIFSIKDTDVEVFTNDEKFVIRIIGVGIVKFEKNNMLCFGQFKKL